MKIEFDPHKSNRNATERSLPFILTYEFDWESAIYVEDVRNIYPEQRFIAIGYIGNRLHVICFSPIDGGVRIISFRKANFREITRYEKQIINK